jgi:predicted ABC-type sugar transport system permease subunit
LCAVSFVAVLYFDYIPWWGALLISIGVGIFSMLLVQFILVPYERKRVVGEFTVLRACVHRTT